jgi:hypothetical protein
MYLYMLMTLCLSIIITFDTILVVQGLGVYYNVKYCVPYLNVSGEKFQFSICRE